MRSSFRFQAFHNVRIAHIDGITVASHGFPLAVKQEAEEKIRIKHGRVLSENGTVLEMNSGVSTRSMCFYWRNWIWWCERQLGNLGSTGRPAVRTTSPESKAMGKIDSRVNGFLPVEVGNDNKGFSVKNLVRVPIHYRQIFCTVEIILIRILQQYRAVENSPNR
ncbi:hypothetical protein ACLOJK_014022 [Asimina triloba]